MKYNKRRKNKYKGKLVFTGMLLFTAGILFLSPWFYVSDINVDGTRVLEKKQLIESAEIEKGMHILSGVSGSFKDYLSLRHRQREENIKQSFSYIKDVQVKSVFPGKISVDVTERVEIAYIAMADGFAVIDSEGIAIEVIKDNIDLEIPVIKGVQINHCKTGEKLIVDIKDYLDNSIIVLNDIVNADKDSRLDFFLLQKMVSIRPVYGNIVFMTFNMPENNEQLVVRAKVDSDTFENMLWLRFAMDQGVLYGNEGKVLDLTTSQRAFRNQ